MDVTREPAATDDVEPACAAAMASLRSSLRHVLVVGGTFTEWDALSDAAWEARIDELGRLSDLAGVPWLTIRAYESGDTGAASPPQRRRRIGGCEVIVDPCGDGRQRFADAMQLLDPADQVNEASVAGVLYDPADSEPDLVVVLGPSTQLPPSVVWELAYAELVFIPVAWQDLAASDLDAALVDFAHRRRRFGGLDAGDDDAGDDE